MGPRLNVRPCYKTLAFIFVLATAAALPACEEEKQVPVDAVTSATPGVRSRQLSAAHPGWRNADCFGCHVDVHLAGYRNPDCTGCHGSNGAPPRPADHPADHLGHDSCKECHTGAHDGVAFTGPKDCRVCHHHEPAGDVCAHTEDADVVVIGGGGGGLSAAATLVLHGQDVVLLEQHHEVGGCMNTFQRSVYNIEVSLHGFDALDEGATNIGLLESLDILHRVKPIKIDPLYTSVLPDFDYTVPATKETYQGMLLADFPHEADGLTALFEELDRLRQLLAAAMLFEETGELPPGTTVDDLLYLLELMETPLLEFLDRFIHDEKLIGLFSVLSGFAGTRPSQLSTMMFVAIWNSYHNEGYYYFEGGSGAVALAMADVIEENGGRIELNARATKIMVRDDRATQVRTADGRCFNARYVVSNASARATLLGMVGKEHLPQDYVRDIEKMKVGASTFVVYLGVDRDYSAEFGEAHELMTSLGYDSDVDFDAGLACNAERVGMALVNYTMIDPTASPPGKNVITITTLLPFDCNNEWSWDESHEAYKQYRESVAATLLSRAETYLPDLTRHIEVMEIGTPLTIRAFTLSYRGTIFGWDNIPEHSFQNRLQQQTPIDNLLLAGQWTFPGGGQSAVMISGRDAAWAILDAEQE